MKLYCIDNEKSSGKAVVYLKSACESLGVEFIEITAEKFDATEAPALEPGDALYRISTDKTSREIEKFLTNDSAVTFYDYFIARPDLVRGSYIALKNSAVPMPKTIPVSTANRKILKKYAMALGGFPMIVKVIGGSQGIGVIKVDSAQALYSIVDFLNKSGEKYIFREFIQTNESARLVVVGERVVASINYRATSDDFRSNNRIKKENVENKKYSPEVEQSAIEATKLKGLQFGGVDILFDEAGNHYVLEVNFPFVFHDVQRITEVDVAREMVLHLQRKAEELFKKNN